MARFLEMNEEELNKTVEEFVRHLEEAHVQMVEWMYENRTSFLPKILKIIQEKGYIDGEGINYFPEEYPFTSEEFSTFFDSVTGCMDSEHGYLCDNDNPFEHKKHYMQCGNTILEFFIMYGQGTATSINMVENRNSIEPRLIGNVEQWVKYVEDRFQRLKNDSSEEAIDEIVEEDKKTVTTTNYQESCIMLFNFEKKKEIKKVNHLLSIIPGAYILPYGLVPDENVGVEKQNDQVSLWVPKSLFLSAWTYVNANELKLGNMTLDSGKEYLEIQKNDARFVKPERYDNIHLQV